jgi:hypothetical protein
LLDASAARLLPLLLLLPLLPLLPLLLLLLLLCPTYCLTQGRLQCHSLGQGGLSGSASQLHQDVITW